MLDTFLRILDSIHLTFIYDGISFDCVALESALATARSQLAHFIETSAKTPQNGSFKKRFFPE